MLGGPIGVYETEAYPFIVDEFAAIAARSMPANRSSASVSARSRWRRRSARASRRGRSRRSAGRHDAHDGRRGVGACAARSVAGAALARRQLRAAGRMRATGGDAALSGSGVHRAPWQLALQFHLEPSRPGSSAGSSAIPSNSAKPASIRAICARRCSPTGRRRELGGEVLAAWLDSLPGAMAIKLRSRKEGRRYARISMRRTLNSGQSSMELTPAERLDLAEELWDSVEPREMPPLTKEQKQELDRRYAEHLRDPTRASKWEDVEARLLARYK